MENKICRINGVEIVAVKNESGEIYVPIKPICQAIGIDPEGQRQRIIRDRRLSSVAFTVKATGADGKLYDMFSLPLKYSYGWIFSIDTNLVSEASRSKVEMYQDECYDVLYDHFERQTHRQKEWVEREKEVLAAKAAALEEISGLRKTISEKQGIVRKADEDLVLIQKERLDDQPTLFD